MCYPRNKNKRGIEYRIGKVEGRPTLKDRKMNGYEKDKVCRMKVREE